jgi:hypothetical protein
MRFDDLEMAATDDGAGEGLILEWQIAVDFGEVGGCGL